MKVSSILFSKFLVSHMSMRYFTNDFARRSRERSTTQSLQKVTQCRTTWKKAENKSHLHTHTPSPTTTSTNLLIRSPVENFQLTRKLELLPFPKISSNVSSLRCNPIYSASNNISSFLFATILRTNSLYTHTQRLV